MDASKRSMLLEKKNIDDVLILISMKKNKWKKNKNKAKIISYKNLSFYLFSSPWVFTKHIPDIKFRYPCTIIECIWQYLKLILWCLLYCRRCQTDGTIWFVNVIKGKNELSFKIFTSVLYVREHNFTNFLNIW